MNIWNSLFKMVMRQFIVSFKIITGSLGFVLFGLVFTLELLACMQPPELTRIPDSGLYMKEKEYFLPVSTGAGLHETFHILSICTFVCLFVRSYIPLHFRFQF